MVGSDGSAVYYLSQPRDLRTLTLHRLEPATGEVTAVLSETGATRVEPKQWMYEPPMVRVLADEVLWYSQLDGWGHLYRYDLRTGALLGQVHLRGAKRRCQRRTVPGVTSRCTRSLPGRSRISAAITARSAQSKRGRGWVPAQHGDLMPQHQGARRPWRPTTG